MNTRDKVISMIDMLSEQQLEGLCMFMGGILDIPNDETLEAMAETEDMIKNPQNYKSYSNVDQMFEEILHEV